MKIVFCITCKNRAFHLKQTLPKNLAGNPKSMFVVLDYGTQDDLLIYLKPHLKPGRLAVYTYENTGKFNMTHAKNMAHRLGILEGGDVLVNLDADNYLGVGFEDYIAEHIKKDTFLGPPNMWKFGGRKMLGAFGRIAVSTNAFLKTGGYNEKYTTWGPDDKEFSVRLEMLGYNQTNIDLQYLKLIPHGDDLRFKEYPEARRGWHHEIFSPRNVTTGIANYGKVGCGKVFRHENLQEINLESIPTRIFGIGMHKTATTSLHAALQILKYESVHWPSAAWVQSVWDQMHFYGKSRTLETAYAATDLPIPLLYKQLDKTYPNSKFILTVRDDFNWLRSVSNHFSLHNSFRWEWDEHPINHEMHQALYGRLDFDASIFLARYRQHNAEVIEYFKDRPEDLLVMDMTKRRGWVDLCKFLDKPIPKVNYPREFITKEHLI